LFESSIFSESGQDALPSDIKIISLATNPLYFYPLIFPKSHKSFAVYKLKQGELKLWAFSKEFFNILEAMRKDEVEKAKREFKEFVH